MAIPYERQTNITKPGEVTQKPQTTENTAKSPKNSYKDFMDKSKIVMYNNGKENTSLSDTLLSQNWKEKNKDSMRYAGDSAKKSIDAGLKEALDFMRDADESTSLEDVQSASVKRKLANDSNNTELARKATMELIGHLSRENKEPYLKHAEPLQIYIDAKDDFDYKHNNYTTTENLDTTPDEKVREAQQRLNELGYADKYGEPLKEDGILGAKTLFANDNYAEDIGYASNEGNVVYNVTALSNPTENASQQSVNRIELASRAGTRTESRETSQNKTSNTYINKFGIVKWRELPDKEERLPIETNLYREKKISKKMYDAMDFISRRWFYADTPNGRNQIIDLANTIRKNDYEIEDCSEEANKQLSDNGNIIKGLRIAGTRPTVDLNNLFYTLACYAATGIGWYFLVDKGGKWDYKAQIDNNDWIPENRTFLYYGQIITVEDFGNLNYGYTGTILGLTPETLYKGGGKVNPNPTQDEIKYYYGDTEVDHYWIKKGIEQANKQGYEGKLELPVDQIFEGKEFLGI